MFKSKRIRPRRTRLCTGEDTFDFRGASRLASTVHRYWHERGMDPDVYVTPLAGFTSTWVVRSDMINGAPRDFALHGQEPAAS